MNNKDNQDLGRQAWSSEEAEYVSKSVFNDI